MLVRIIAQECKYCKGIESFLYSIKMQYLKKGFPAMCANQPSSMPANHSCHCEDKKLYFESVTLLTELLEMRI